MTRKQIDASREIRLWIGQVAIPAAVAVITISSNPEAKAYVENKFEGMKSKVKSVFKK